MKNHYLVKLFVLAITTVLFSTMAWSQSKLSGDGTEGSPYQIKDQTDWMTFANDINHGRNTTAYYILKDDVTLGSEQYPITTVVGDNVDNNHIDTTRMFKGHFDGNRHTLTVYIDRGTKMFGAPFGVVARASIKNLVVDGVIKTQSKYCGGVVGWAVNTYNSPTTITNCTSKVSILSETDGDGTHGGLVGQNQRGYMVVENCMFDGTIEGTKTTKCAGFLGWANDKVDYFNCAMAGVISVKDLDETYQRYSTAKIAYNNAYYTRDYSKGTQGSEAPKNTPADGLYKVYTVDKTNYYLSATTALQTVYPYTGADIPVKVMQTFYGELMVEGRDYSKTITFKDHAVNCLNEKGDYNLRITGTGNYSGIYKTTISVIDETTWDGLRKYLGQEYNITYTLSREYIADANNDKAIRIKGNVVLNMKGHSLDRNLDTKQEDGFVIHVLPGASLTINGRDGATIKGGNNIGNGGGIYNEGTLILNNVTVSNNEANLVANPVYGTGGGVYCQGSNTVFRMVGGELSNNKCHGGGGGVHAVEIKECSITNVSVHHNTSTSKGAGIRVKTANGRVATISDCRIYNNMVKDDNQSMGGGVYYEGSAKMIINNCEIYSNSVTKDGGGIHAHDNGTLELTDCTIRENNSGNLGGGVYLNEKMTIRVNGEVIITDNEGKDFYDNVYFVKSNGVITINAGFKNTSSIALSRAGNNAGVITNGLASVSADEKCFISDYAEFTVRLSDSGEAEFPAVFIKDGNWNDGTKWNTGSVPSAGSDVTIEARATVPNGYTANAGEITMGSGGSITLEDGGQLVSTTSVPVEIKKTINKASVEVGSFAKNCYTLSTPTHDNGSNQQLIENITNLTSYEYDMFKYDEPTNIWLNQKTSQAAAGFSSMDISTGYIYRNGLDDGIDDIDVLFNGYTNVGSINSYTLTNTNDEGEGFNLIGNPYPHTIYKGVAFATTSDTLSDGYFRLLSDGTWMAQTDDLPIEVGEAVFVQAAFKGTEGGKLLQFKDRASAPAAKYNNDAVEFVVSNSEYEDVTYALFDKGVGLNKINHRNPEVQMIYINKDGEDFAIAMMDDATKTFNLNFKAQTTGSYTLSYKTRGEFSYLHVIDRLTGEDVDMLVEDKYSFIGSPKDNEARFIVRLQYHPDYGEGDDIFAYQNGGNVIVRGEGELQVFDVMGRFVMSRKVSGEEAFSMPASGVYIFRLLGEKLRTQKIVVK